VRSRRSLVIVLVLVASLLLAAALSSGGNGKQATRPADPAQPAPPGRTVVATIPADAKKPPTINARSGDLVELSVLSSESGTVSLGGYDRVEAVDPTSPAKFSISADIEGEHPIELRPDKGSGEPRRVGVLRIGAPAS
jgi:hypothetical protein